MPVKLVKAAGAVHIKSQEELDEVFSRAEAAVQKVRSADAAQALEVYNKVIADGRFVKEFGTDPGGTAQKLGLKLSPAQIAQIEAAYNVIGQKPIPDSVEVVCVAIIVLALAASPVHRDLVVDTSGIVKA
jgi:hypothetical protein